MKPDFDKIAKEVTNKIWLGVIGMDCLTILKDDFKESLESAYLEGRKAQVKVDRDIAASHTSTDGECPLSLANVE